MDYVRIVKDLLHGYGSVEARNIEVKNKKLLELYSSQKQYTLTDIPLSVGNSVPFLQSFFDYIDNKYIFNVKKFKENPCLYEFLPKYIQVVFLSDSKIILNDTRKNLNLDEDNIDFIMSYDSDFGFILE